MNAEIMAKEDDKFGKALSDIIDFRTRLDQELNRLRESVRQQPKIKSAAAITGSVKEKAEKFATGEVSNVPQQQKLIDHKLAKINALQGSKMINSILAPLQVKNDQGHDEMKAKLQQHLLKGELLQASDMLTEIYVTQKLVELNGDRLFKEGATQEQNTEAYNKHKDQLQNELKTFNNILDEVARNKDKTEAKKGILQKLAGVLQVMFDKLKINIQISKMSGKEKLTKSLKQMSVATGVIKTAQSTSHSKGDGSVPRL